MQFLSIVLTLLLVMDPVGNIPLFLTALRPVAPARRTFVVLRESGFALVILLVFLVIGRGLLDVLHVTADALAVGGGVVLLLIAIKMVFPTPEGLHEAVLGEPFLVPLAVPYLAGPSMLATEILLVSTSPSGLMWYHAAAVVVAWLVSTGVLASAGWLQRYLGDRVLTALERLMGMVLVIIAVQMMLTGLKQFFLAG